MKSMVDDSGQNVSPQCRSSMTILIRHSFQIIPGHFMGISSRQWRQRHPQVELVIHVIQRDANALERQWYCPQVFRIRTSSAKTELSEA